MVGDALWYEAAQVVGITNALNVGADGLGAAGLTPVEPARASAEVRAVFEDIQAFYGSAEVPAPSDAGEERARMTRRSTD